MCVCDVMAQNRQVYNAQVGVRFRNELLEVCRQEDEHAHTLRHRGKRSLASAILLASEHVLATLVLG